MLPSFRTQHVTNLFAACDHMIGPAKYHPLNPAKRRWITFIEVLPTFNNGGRSGQHTPHRGVHLKSHQTERLFMDVDNVGLEV